MKKDTRFQNRRRMAWISFFFMLMVGGWMLVLGVTQEGAADRVEKLSFLLGSIFGMCTTIIVSYFTSSTMTQMNDTKFVTDDLPTPEEPQDAPH